MSAIRLGLVGAGQIARLSAAEFRSHPDCRIVAIADPSASRASELAGQLGGLAVHPSIEALLAAERVDAVYIAVPNLQHEPAATAALEAGCHVLLDKPFAIDLGAAERIAAAAGTSDRTLMLGMNQRFERRVQQAKQLCLDNRFGEIYHLKAFWRRRAGIPRLGSWFTSKAVAGGGALLDIGVHVLDVALHLLDEFKPAAVSGATFTRFGNRGLGEGSWGKSEREHTRFDVDDFATALIRLESGAVITLEAAWALHQRQPSEHDVVIYGENAGMTVYSGELFEPGTDDEYRIVQNPGSTEIRYPHCSRAWHFINVLAGTEPPSIDLDQSLAVQRILDGIYRSAATGAEVTL